MKRCAAGLDTLESRYRVRWSDSTVSIIPPLPADVWQCKVLSSLREKSTPDDGAAERAAVFIETAAPLNDLTIAGPFKHYTLHNRDHSKKLLHLSEYLMSQRTLEQLSVLDHLVIVYSAYLHDMGMSLTELERDRVLKSPDFSDFTQEWEELWDELVDARSRLKAATDPEKFAIETEIFQLHEAALAAYLRPRHATPERYRNLIVSLKIQTKRPDLFEYRGVSFEDLLVDVCASHNLDVSVLAEVRGPYEERFPRRAPIGGVYLNAQFCAAILRLSDIMDFDRERTPRVLFESLGLQSRSLPGAELSLREWQKHMAVHSLEINKDEVVVSADSNHPVIEKTIREFCQIIEREIRDTLAVLKRNPLEIAERYQLELPISVRSHVRSMGYVYKDMSLSLNQPRIMALLMGGRLYSTPAAAVRELIQNSIDACAARMQSEEGEYVPNIRVHAESDSLGRRWLEVSDNGCGMDEYVLSEYFLKLGNSYYRSPEFGRMTRQLGNNQRHFSPISRFGIGIASAFLIGDVLEVKTRSAHSPRRDHEGRTVRIEKLGALVFLTAALEAPPGSSVKVRLLPQLNDTFEEFARQVVGYLKSKIVRPRFPIDVALSGDRFVLCSKGGIVLRPDAGEVLATRGIELVALDISRWTDKMSGQALIFLNREPDGKLSHLKDGKFLRFGTTTGIDPNDFLLDFTGNRATINGFTMNLKKMSRALGNGKKRLPVLLDVDIRGDDDVEYDISRDRIVGVAGLVVRRGLQLAIYDGLRDTGVLERLSPETRKIVENSVHGSDSVFSGVDKEALLERALELIPEGKRPPQFQRVLAMKMSISHSEAWELLKYLEASGRIARSD
jgi:molecular chaperone HtpG